MPRERDPRRDKAFNLFKKHGGNIQNREIATQLGVPEKTISAWKSRDKWNAVLQKNDCSTTKGKSRGGAPKGNKNSIGHGAPKGNKNALGNSGGPPPRNQNAVTTGEHQTLWYDALGPDEIARLGQLELDPIKQLDEDIRLYSWRERRMMLRIRDLENGLTEKQRRILRERRKIKDTVQVHDEKSGATRTVAIPQYEMVEVEDEETSFRAIDDVLKIEEALTRIQDKKIKALDMKYRITGDNGSEDSKAWVEGLSEIAERRRQKVKQDE